MKNIVFTSIIIFVIAVSFTSCKKQSVGTTSTKWDTTNVYDTSIILDSISGPKSITGFYIGKIGNSSDYPSFQMAFLLRTNGTARVYNNTLGMPGNVDTSSISPAEGTYIVSGDTVTTYCRYLYDTTNTFTTQGIVNSDSTYMEGSWGYGMSIGSGNFFVYKEF